MVVLVQCFLHLLRCFFGPEYPTVISDRRGVHGIAFELAGIDGV